MTSLLEPLTFSHGPTMKNRFVLAPLTNQQSNDDGSLSEDEFKWVAMRAAGGFGLTMTCASHVQKNGRGFPGQLGIWSDDHIPGLKRLVDAIKAQDSIAIAQLHHAGMRSPADLIGEAPVPHLDHGVGGGGDHQGNGPIGHRCHPPGVFNVYFMKCFHDIDNRRRTILILNKFFDGCVGRQ